MFKLIKFFKGYAYVEISGYSPERFMNLCVNSNIVLWDVVSSENGFCFYISIPALEFIEPLLQKTGTQLKVIKLYGIPVIMKKYKKHSFFGIGLLCAFFIMFYMGEFVWKVDISGNSYYSKQVIVDFLENQQIGYGVYKKKIDCKGIQDLLRSKFEDITWVSAKLEGTKLTISIKERVKGETISTELQNDIGYDLIATCSGVIESISTRQGTPLVEAGDTVSEGDLLVAGTITLYDDYNEVIGRKQIMSDADVWIRTQLPYTDKFPKENNVITNMTKKRIGIRLRLHNYIVSLLLPSANEETHLLEEKQLVIGKDFYLPIYYTKIVRVDSETLASIYSDKEIKTVSKQHLIQYCKKLEQNSVQILSKSVIIDDSGNYVQIHGTLDVLMKQTKLSKTIEIESEEGNNLNGTDTAND